MYSKGLHTQNTNFCEIQLGAQLGPRTQVKETCPLRVPRFSRLSHSTHFFFFNRRKSSHLYSTFLGATCCHSLRLHPLPLLTALPFLICASCRVNSTHYTRFNSRKPLLSFAPCTAALPFPKQDPPRAFKPGWGTNRRAVTDG